MEMTKRKVTVTENGKTIYEGPEKRTVIYDAGKLFWGLTFTDLFKMGVVIAGCAIGYQNINIGIADIKKSQKEMKQQIADYQDCMKNSDLWHTAVTGTQFKCGEPINTAYNTKALNKGLKSLMGDDDTKQQN